MNRRNRFGTAASMIALATVLAGCASDSSKRESIFGSKVDRSNIGLATRAQVALAGGDTVTAVQYAERAVQNTPNDAGFRALLGNSYFAAGRFASAEAAYRDSLALLPVQPKLILKMALVQIAQGKNAEALALLDASRGALDPSDYGLALALAGRADDAVAILNHAARAAGADAQVRQNLALAYGLAGDWTMARTVAAQDVPAAQLDGRVQQWMAMATPQRASDQVAALTGVTPAAADPGQPQQLALNRAPAPQPQRQAEVAAAQPQPEFQPQQVVEVPYSPPPALPEPMPAPMQMVAPEPAPAPVEAAPEAIPAMAVVQPPEPEPDPAVVAAVHSLMQPAAAPVVELPAVVAEAPLVQAVRTAPVPKLPTSFEATVQPAAYVAISDTVRRAAERSRKAKGNSRSVVQLGAYKTPERVMVAWNDITRRYPALRDYTPMRARFQSPKGIVWRLSIKGFASQKEAAARCEKLQSRGGSCFVRTIAGDSPVQLASR